MQKMSCSDSTLYVFGAPMSPVGVTDAEGVGSTLSTCGKGPLTLNGNRTLSPNACKRKHMLEESPTGKIPHCPVWFKIKAVKHLRVITRWALRMPCLSHSHIILQRMNPQGIHGFEIDILSGRYRFKGMHDCGLLLYAFQGRVFFGMGIYIIAHQSPILGQSGSQSSNNVLLLWFHLYDVGPGMEGSHTILHWCIGQVQ